MAFARIASTLLLGFWWTILVFCENQNVTEINSGIFNEPDFPTRKIIMI